MELELSAPPRSVITISIEFDKLLLRWDEYPPDQARFGFLLSIEHTLIDWTAMQGLWCECGYRDDSTKKHFFPYEFFLFTPRYVKQWSATLHRQQHGEYSNPRLQHALQRGHADIHRCGSCFRVLHKAVDPRLGPHYCCWEECKSNVVEVKKRKEQGLDS